MLTKEERAVIAERLKNAGRLNEFTFYEALTGKQMAPSWDLRAGEVLNIIVNLCDTSNMVELPVDRDGEVIRIGDVVYDEDGDKYEVMGYEVDDSETNIILDNESGSVSISAAPNELTHKQPVTAKSLAQRIRDVLRNDHSEMSPYTSRELVHIANDLERLGDNDE